MLSRKYLNKASPYRKNRERQIWYQQDGSHRTRHEHDYQVDAMD